MMASFFLAVEESAYWWYSSIVNDRFMYGIMVSVTIFWFFPLLDRLLHGPPELRVLRAQSRLVAELQRVLLDQESISRVLGDVSPADDMQDASSTSSSTDSSICGERCDNDCTVDAGKWGYRAAWAARNTGTCGKCRTGKRRRRMLLKHDNPFGLEDMCLSNVARFLCEKDLARFEISCHMNVRWSALYRLILFQRLGRWRVLPNKHSSDGWEARARSRYLTEHLWHKLIQDYLWELRESIIENLQKSLPENRVVAQRTFPRLWSENRYWRDQLEKQLEALEVTLDKPLRRIHDNMLAGRLVLDMKIGNGRGAWDFGSCESTASVFILLSLDGKQHLLFSVKHHRQRTHNVVYWVRCPTHNWLSLCQALATTPNIRALLCDPRELMVTDYQLPVDSPNAAFAKVNASALRDLWDVLGLGAPGVSGEQKAIICVRWIWALCTTHSDELLFRPLFRITGVTGGDMS
eukprot:GEMP01038654.1.p1 GENE.GEMP01038654.1~~GEMP01038654.1.p1  ORF type:complete len:464 (-),score=105.67 GEMP01038654.1:428-1819(-)